MVYKILSSIQKDTTQQSAYWQILKVVNNEDRWDDTYQYEISLIKPFGQIVRQALKASDSTIKTKMQLETSYIDGKYYMQVLNSVKEAQMKNKLLNCLLISRHFMLVLQKKVPDFTDYPNIKKTIE